MMYKCEKMGMELNFDPNSTVEFEAFFQKENWAGLLYSEQQCKQPICIPSQKAFQETLRYWKLAELLNPLQCHEHILHCTMCSFLCTYNEIIGMKA